MTTSSRDITWTPEFDASIPLALEVARTRCPVGSTNRRDELLRLAREFLVARHSKLRSLTEDALAKRITALNSGKSKGDPTYIWVSLPPWRLDDSPPHGEGVKTDTPHPADDINGVPAVMQPVMAQQTASSPSLLTETVELLSRQHGDIAALMDLHLQELQQNREQMRGVTDAIARLAESVRILAEAKQPQPPPAEKSAVPVADPKKPRVPNRTDDVTDVTRADVCFGPEWEAAMEIPLTTNEKNWQTLFRHLVQRRQGGTSRITSTGVIVFGWFPTVHNLQQIFYRLGPDHVRWIHTYRLDLRPQQAVNKIHPKFGHFALICPNYREDNVNPNGAAIDTCKIYGIPYVTVPGHNVNTDHVAFKLLTAIYRREWEDLSRRLLSERAVKDVNCARVGV